MSLWEFNAVVSGRVKANTVPEDRKASAPSEDEYFAMISDFGDITP